MSHYLQIAGGLLVFMVVTLLLPNRIGVVVGFGAVVATLAIGIALILGWTP